VLLFNEKDCYGNKKSDNSKEYYENKQYDGNKHYEIIKKIRNFSTLNASDLEFIKNLSQKELVDIIEILNLHSERINNYFMENNK